VLDLMGQVAHRRGRLDSAAVLLEGAVAIGEERLRANHRILADARRNLAALMIDQGRMAEATDLLAGVLEVERAVRPSPHYRIGATYTLLARLEVARGADAEASRLLRAALAEFRNLPRDHWRVVEAQRLLESATTDSGG
jgi:hypothetical protein